MQETLLKPTRSVKKETVENKFTFPGYSVVRRDRPDDATGRGLATLIIEGLAESPSKDGLFIRYITLSMQIIHSLKFCLGYILLFFRLFILNKNG